MKEEKNEIEDNFYLDNEEPGSENEDELQVDYLQSIGEAVTWSTDWTIDTIVNSMSRRLFSLDPSFQRRDAWNTIQKSRFIESLIYGLPVPQMVLAESTSGKEKFLVVDGKQRLTTLQRFFSNDPQEQFALTGLKNPKLNGCTADLLKSSFPKLYDNLATQSMRSVIIKNWQSENLLYTIFFRLNSGSLALSPQELRKALRPGPFMDYIDTRAAKSKNILALLNRKSPDPRMRDVDLVLRYFALCVEIENYTGNYKQFLDDLCGEYNADFLNRKAFFEHCVEKLEHAISIAKKVFGDEKVFRRISTKKNEQRINRALFDVICFYFSESRYEQKILAKKNAIKNMLNELLKDNPAFLKSVSSNTNNLKECSTRFVLFGQALAIVLGLKIEIPSHMTSHYDSLK